MLEWIAVLTLITAQAEQFGEAVTPSSDCAAGVTGPGFSYGDRFAQLGVGRCSDDPEGTSIIVLFRDNGESAFETADHFVIGDVRSILGVDVNQDEIFEFITEPVDAPEHQRELFYFDPETHGFRRVALTVEPGAATSAFAPAGGDSPEDWLYAIPFSQNGEQIACWYWHRDRSPGQVFQSPPPCDTEQAGVPIQVLYWRGF